MWRHCYEFLGREDGLFYRQFLMVVCRIGVPHPSSTMDLGLRSRGPCIMEDPIEPEGTTAPTDEPPVAPLALQTGSPCRERASGESSFRPVYRLRLQMRSIGSLIGERFYLLVLYSIVVSFAVLSPSGLGLLFGAIALLVYSLSLRDCLHACGHQKSRATQNGTSLFSFMLGTLVLGMAAFSFLFVPFS